MRHRFPRRAVSARRSKASRYCVAVVVMITVTTLLLSGCGSFKNDDEERGYWSPFHSQSNWSMDQGSMRVELTGFERGHQPGEESEFQIIIENRRQQPVTLDVCVQLIDRERVVQEFNDFQIELGPDAAGRRALNTAFDEELEPKAYGLAVVIGELGAVVHTVRLGLADDDAGPWLDAGELSCDP